VARHSWPRCDTNDFGRIDVLTQALRSEIETSPLQDLAPDTLGAPRKQHGNAALNPGARRQDPTKWLDLRRGPASSYTDHSPPPVRTAGIVDAHARGGRHQDPITDPVRCISVGGVPSYAYRAHPHDRVVKLSAHISGRGAQALGERRVPER